MAKAKGKSKKSKGSKKGKKPKPKPIDYPYLLQDAHVYTNSSTGTTCPGVQDKDRTGRHVVVGCQRSTSNGRCYRGYFHWDVSMIPSTANIDSILFAYTVANIAYPRNCHIVPFDINPQTSSAQDVWNHITNKVNSGTFLLQNINDFNTTGNHELPLGQAACNDMKNKLANGWWAFGIVYISETRDAQDHYCRIVSIDHPTEPLENLPKLTVTWP